MTLITREGVEVAIRACAVRPQALDSLPLAGDETAGDYLFWYSADGASAYLVSPVEGQLAAVELQPPPLAGRLMRSVMCNICLTVHPPSGIAIWSNRPRRWSSLVAGDLVCRGFECREFISGGRPLPLVMQLPETIGPDARRSRMQRNLERFMARLVAAAAPDFSSRLDAEPPHSAGPVE